MSKSPASETSFIERIHAHQGILHKVCFMFTGHGIECADLQQEIIYQMWKSYPEFREESAFSTWMYRIALNTAMNLTRRPSVFVDRVELPQICHNPEAEMELSEDLKLLRRAIGHLSKTDRLIILLWLDEQSYNEIAAIVGITESNVSVRLVRIRTRLGKIMKRINPLK